MSLFNVGVSMASLSLLLKMSSSLERVFIIGLSNPSSLFTKMTRSQDNITDLFSADNSVFDISCFKKSYSFSANRVLLLLTKP